MSETTYIVLRNEGETAGWQFITGISRTTAASATEAIRKVAAQAVKSDGTWVAVPARSWKPVTVQAVQTTVLKLEEATSSPPASPS